MLTQLYIQNIAVIEQASIDFEPGFTVLTGETGAGKSIIIDAIYAVLGERTSKELVRTGAEQASVSALFTDVSPQTQQVLRELDIPLEDDGSLLIRREIRPHGRSSCKLNNIPATVSMLRAVGGTLIDILGQHESYKLLSPEVHGTYIDSFAGAYGLLAEYRAAYTALRRIKGELDALESDEGQKSRRMDILRYQIEELEAAQLRVGEQAELTERRDEIRNSERIVRGVGEAVTLLQGDEDNGGAITAVSVAAESLEQAARYAPSLSNVAEHVRDAEYALTDAAAEISDYLDNAMFDANELDEIESRLEVIYRLSLKYGETEEEMLSFLDRARAELSDIEFSDEKKELLLQQYEQKKKEAVTLAKQLSAKRRAACESFSRRVRQELSELNMPGVVFTVEAATASSSSSPQTQVRIRSLCRKLRPAASFRVLCSPSTPCCLRIPARPKRRSSMRLTPASAAKRRIRLVSSCAASPKTRRSSASRTWRRSPPWRITTCLSSKSRRTTKRTRRCTR